MSFLDTGISNDPFFGDVQQTNRLRAICVINVGGTDVTAKVAPFLIQVRILNGNEHSQYNCEIELDDRDGKLPIPPIGAPITVNLGWVGENTSVVFEGLVLDVEHGFGRKEGGRRMWIHGHGSEWLGLGKAPMNNHMGEGAPDGGGETGTEYSLQQWLTSVAGSVNHSIQIHPDLAGIMQDYWEQTNESYYHHGQRLASQFGANFRIKAGTIGQFSIPGVNVDGTPNTSIKAVWGQNLIGWRVHPMAARPMWQKSRQNFYDIGKGQWKVLEKTLTAVGMSGFSNSVFQLPNPAPNSSQATNDNEGDDTGMKSSIGPGKIVINGEPTAFGNSHVIIVGARPGVDGEYLVDTAEHIYSRQGYVTWLDVTTLNITGQGKVGSSGGPYTQYKPPTPTTPPAPSTPPAPTTPSN